MLVPIGARASSARFPARPGLEADERRGRLQAAMNHGKCGIKDATMDGGR